MRLVELNYETGGNPYRGMIYGMTGRLHICTPYLWQVLDAFGIEDAEMIGYWRKDCPVQPFHLTNQSQSSQAKVG